METGPAPQRALRSSQRFAVSTCQRSSGLAKLIRADFCALPLFQVAAKSAIASDGSRMSRVTVLTVPPRDVELKRCDQLVGAGKGIYRLLATVVPMIAFAGLVVVPKDADATDGDNTCLCCQPIQRGGLRLWGRTSALTGDQEAHWSACAAVSNDRSGTLTAATIEASALCGSNKSESNRTPHRRERTRYKSWSDEIPGARQPLLLKGRSQETRVRHGPASCRLHLVNSATPRNGTLLACD
jgi:hypothetical protein